MTGIVCVDKPQGLTSFACCAALRRLTGEKHVGHAGTLDPMATGVLPILLGRATRAIPLLPTHNKTYQATLRFGCTSSTLDVWGTLSETGAPPPTPAALQAALPSFRGDIWQIPPMVSALKQNGVRLYELARRGIEVPREARPVTVFRLELLEYNEPAGEATVECECSAGTYIRTLCDDLGQLLGCGAVMTSLRRTAAAGFTVADCHTLDEWQSFGSNGTLAAHVRPVDTAFAHLPAVYVSAAQTVRFVNGGALALDRLGNQTVSGTARVYAPTGAFLGLGTPKNGELAPLRLLSEI